jgi:photoactive yellow protein
MSGFHDANQTPEAGEAGPVDVVERLASMSREEVDDLPYGFVVLDEAGTVLLYNRYESSLSRLSPEGVIGKNWFKEIAPCTRVEAFYGRFRALVESPEKQQEGFRFRFYFMHGAQDVAVQLVKAPPVVSLPMAQAEGATRVFMTVVRRAVAEAETTPAAGGELQTSLGT